MIIEPLQYYSMSTHEQSKKKRADLSLAMKIKMIKDMEAGMKQKDVAEKYDVNRTTITKIMKNKENLITLFEVKFTVATKCRNAPAVIVSVI